MRSTGESDAAARTNEPADRAIRSRATPKHRYQIVVRALHSKVTFADVGVDAAWIQGLATLFLNGQRQSEPRERILASLDCHRLGTGPIVRAGQGRIR